MILGERLPPVVAGILPAVEPGILPGHSGVRLGGSMPPATAAAKCLPPHRIISEARGNPGPAGKPIN